MPCNTIADLVPYLLSITVLVEGFDGKRDLWEHRSSISYSNFKLTAIKNPSYSELAIESILDLAF